MITKRLFAAAALVGAALLAPAASSTAAMLPQASNDTVLPGYWEYTTSALGVRDTETKCVRPSEINRFFGGLSEKEIAEVTGVSTRTVRREWNKARVLLVTLIED